MGLPELLGRDWLLARGMELPDGERVDAVLAQTGLSRCPALNAGLVVIDGKKAVFDRSALPEPDEHWAQLAQALLLGLARSAQDESVLDPLLGVLFAIAWENEAPRSEAALSELWWDTPLNWCATGLTDQERARQLSDQYLQRCLVMFGDTGGVDDAARQADRDGDWLGPRTGSHVRARTEFLEGAEAGE